MKKTYKELPANYWCCSQSDCPQASTCLHRIAYTRLSETEELLYLINPKRCSSDNGCPYYRSNVPVAYARGFTNFQQHMFPKQYATFMAQLIDRFGRNPYFERRRGDYPLPPHEQQLIRQALKNAGVKVDLPFDAYETLINWYD